MFIGDVISAYCKSTKKSAECEVLHFFRVVTLLLLALHGRTFDREGGLVVREVGLEAGDIGRVRSNLCTGIAGEDNLVQVVREAQMATVVHEEGSQEGDAPGTALARRLHHGDGGVKGGGEDALAHDRRLEQAAVARDTVHLDVLFPEQHVVSDLQHYEGAIELGAHEVRQRKVVGGAPYKQRASFREARDGLAGDVVEGDEAAAVRIALEGLLEENAVNVVLVLDGPQ